MLIFHNSTPALMVLIVKQDNATEDYFSLSYKTLKQKKERTKKNNNNNKNESSFKWINIIIAPPILRGIITGFYITHRFPEVCLS